MRSEQEKLNGLFIQTCKNQTASLINIRNLLEKGANVNARDERNRTPLIWACIKGHDNIVPLLLSKGAVVNTIDGAGNTPLMIACMNGKQDIVNYLLNAGAHVNASRPQNGGTALMVACINNNIKGVKRLLVAGADINAKDIRGRTVFSFYAKNNPEILKFLYAKKYRNIYNAMRPNNKNTRIKGATVIQKVFRQKQLDEKLLKECRKHVSDFYTIQKLLRQGANVNVRDMHGGPPLVLVCIQNNPMRLVKLLIDNGANINMSSKNDGTTPLIATIKWEKKNHATAWILIQSGVNVNARDKKGNTALIYACENNNKYVTKLLLEAGANPNIRNKNGYNAFTEFKNNPEILKLLYAKKYNTMSPTNKNIRIKLAKTIQSIVRRHYATNKNSQLSKNAITLERIPRRNTIALNGQMYHRNSIASLVAFGNARVPHSRRRIVLNEHNGRYTTQ